MGRKGTLLQFPQVYFVVGGLAAACFALIAVLLDESAFYRDESTGVVNDRRDRQ